MNTIVSKFAAVLAMAAAAAGASAAEAPRLRPYPHDVQSVDSPAGPAVAAGIEALVETPTGTMRVRADVPASDPIDAAEAPETVSVAGSGGQRMRIVPGVEPDRADRTAALALPSGVVVVEAHGAKMLRLPGVDDVHQPPAQEPLADGIRIVDLPPGAVAPDGMPEPMTLYRATSAAAGMPE